MELYKFLIIEDNVCQANYLKKLIEDTYLHFKCVGLATYKNEAKSIIKAQKPDLVLLDINLPSKSPNTTSEPYMGFKILTELEPEYLNFFFIIISGEDKKEYASLACKLSSISFLEKPIVKRELFQAIHFFHLYKKNSTELFSIIQAQINILRANLTEISTRKWLLYINSSRVLNVDSFDQVSEQMERFKQFEFLRLPIYSIVYIHSDNHYLDFYLDYGPNTASLYPKNIEKIKNELAHSPRMTIRGNIGDLDKILEPFNFMCVHSRYLLNMAFCQEFIPKSKKRFTAGSGGEIILKFTNNNNSNYESILKVSRDGAKRLKKIL